MSGGQARPVCFYSSSWRGGDGWYTHALAQHLAAAMAPSGRALWMLTAPMQPQDRQARDPNLRWIELPRGDAGQGGGKLRKVWGTAYRILSATAALVAARRHTRDYLVTFPHWLSATLLQFALVRLMGGRITYIVHDPLPHGWRFPAWARGLERGLIVLTYRLSNHLVTLTESGREKMIGLGFDPDRLTVIPHGAFANPDVTPPTGNRKLLVFGMLRRNKCILETIQAFATALKQYPDLKLVIAGAPYSAELDYWAQCEDALKPLGDAVRLEVGFVPEDRVDQLFSECDAVLAPYSDFSSQSGVAVLSAFSMRPVIGSCAGGIGELFSLGMSGVAISGDINSRIIHQAISGYAERAPSYWGEAALLARDTLAKELAWTAVANRFSKVI